MFRRPVRKILFTYAQAAELLQKAAIIENFVFVPDGQNPHLEVLTLAGTGPNPARLRLAVHKDSRPLPAGKEVIRYVMTFKFLKQADAVKACSKHLGKDDSITAVPDTSAVSITAKASVIRKLIDLKKEIDKP